MQQPRRSAAECKYEVDGSPSTSRKTKLAIAGMALTTAGVMAVSPVTATSALPDTIDTRSSAVNLSASALDHAFTPYTQLVEGLYGEIFAGREVWERVDYRVRIDPDDPNSPWNMPADHPDRYEWKLKFQPSLLTTVRGTASSMGELLDNPAVRENLTSAIQNLANPDNLTNTLSNIPNYAETIVDSGELAGKWAQNVLNGLFNDHVNYDGKPSSALLPRVVELLGEGKFFEAFSELNYYFLVDGLSAGRQSLIDGGFLSLPGDILMDLGLEPLANVVGHSNMELYEIDGKKLSASDGLLGRTVIGNFGRAALAPPITAIFQIVELLDDFQKHLSAGDFDLAVAELVAAPAKVTGAFLVGYVPGPLLNFDAEAGRGQAFPGIFSPTGPLDFVFNQIPAVIAKGLTAQKPVPEEEKKKDDDNPGGDEGRVTGTTEGDDEGTGSTVTGTTEGDDESTGSTVTGTTEGDDEGTGSNIATMSQIGTGAESDDESSSKIAPQSNTNDSTPAFSTKDRVSELGEQIKERHEQRVEKAREAGKKFRETAKEVRTQIQNGLGLNNQVTKPTPNPAGESSTTGGSSTTANDSGNAGPEKKRFSLRDGFKRGGDRNGKGSGSQSSSSDSGGSED